MCGIVGYTGNKNIQDVLIKGLKKLEYRGYDSAGIASFNNNNIELIKASGKITNLEEKLNKENIEFNTSGIAHTRWATHGEPSESNAHPHTSENVILVHNGIIENYTEIREELENKGYEFYSATDTEVACKYINYVYKSEKDKLKCIKKAVSKFRGSYAFSIIFKDEKEKIYVCRLNSPLVIGVSDEDNFVSSDVSAFLDYTNKYILLDHDEYGIITKDKVTIYNNDLEVISKKIEVATWKSNAYDKNGYDHFMQKEMDEQPKVISNVFNRYLNDKDYLNGIDLNKFNNIHIVSCGSAMHAGLIGKYLFETYSEIPTTVELASEYRYKKQLITDKTLVIIISQSGETADTLAALRIANKKGATTLGIVNVVGSSIARESKHVIYTYAGPEIAVATTKGYTTQVSVLSTLALELSKNKISKDMYDEVINEYINIEKTLNDCLNKKDEYIKVANNIYNQNDLFFLGRGLDSSICMEGSLKLKEISYMHSESYAAGELKHGTISLIDKGTPIIGIATNEELFEKTISNIKETRARGAYSIFITTDKLDVTDDFYDLKITVKHVTDFTVALNVIIALQLISYYTAKNRNCDIDKPKNLAKSVTVE